MDKEYIVGVDLGSFKVSATLGIIDEYGELKILDSVVLESQGIENGEILDINVVTSTVKECINNLELLVDDQIKEVYLGIPAGMCNVLEGKGDITLPKEAGKIEEYHLEEVLTLSKVAVPLTDEEIIDIIPYRYVIDDDIEVKDPIGLHVHRLGSNTKLVVVKKSIIMPRLKVFQSIDIKIKAFLIQSEASKDIYSETNYFKENTLIIDTGSDISDVSYYEKGILIDTFSISLGGNIITKDVAFCNNINNKSAEDLKKQDFRLSTISEDKKMENDELSQSNIEEQVILARVEEILSLIRIQTEDKEYKIDNILLLGGGISLFKGIKKIASNIMNKPVYILKPKEILNNPLSINSFSIVKNVYNELRLNENSSNKIQYDKEIKKENKEELAFENTRKRNNKNLATKIKSILEGFF